MECLSIPGTKYGQFSEEIHQKALKGRVPVDGTLETTFHCNLRCRHCYCVCDPKKKELSFEEACRIIDEIVAEGCLWLLITGGEPLIRPDFLDIYTYAKKKGLVVTLFTNGTLLTQTIADHFREYKPFLVEITLYGMSEKTYEAMTGVRGSFKRCMEGIRLLLDRKVPLKLKACVTTLNQHELQEMKRYAQDLGVEFRFDPVINPKVDGSKAPCELRISPQQVVDFDLGDEKRVKAWKEFLESVRHERPDDLFTCGGGRCSFHIDPYGELQLCVIFRRPSFDLRQGTFKEGWDSLFPALHAQKLDRESKCWRCAYSSVCDQCPGWGHLEEDDPEFPVDYLCRIAHLRAKRLLQKGVKNEEKVSEAASQASEIAA